MDVLARRRRIDVVGVLLERACQWFREAEVMLAECCIPPRHPYRGVLRRHGFLDSKQRSGISAETFHGPRVKSLDFLAEKDARVHLMLGDVD